MELKFRALRHDDMTSDKDAIMRAF